MAAVGACTLGLLSSDPASGEFGLLVAPTATAAVASPAVESSLPSSTTVAIAPTAATTANAAPPPTLAATTTAALVALAETKSPPSIEPASPSTTGDQHDESSVPRDRATHDTRPHEGKEHDDD